MGKTRITGFLENRQRGKKFDEQERKDKKRRKVRKRGVLAEATPNTWSSKKKR